MIIPPGTRFILFIFFFFLFTFLLGGEYFHGDSGHSVAAAALVISKRLTTIFSSMV